MSKKVFNMEGGLHSAAAYSALEDALYGSSKANRASFVLSAGSGMQVVISAGDGLIDTGSRYARRIQTDGNETAAVAAASGSFNRIDSVVAYIDNAVTPSILVTDNTNDILKFASVAGTAAATPVAPSGAAIQTAIGAGNPYMVIGNILVPQSASNLSGATFWNMAPIALSKDGWISENQYSWVYASASTFTIAGVDLTALYPIGTRLRLYQGGTVKYFTVLSSVFATNTTITVDGFGTYTLANLDMQAPAYSYTERPAGFPVGIANVTAYNPYKFSAYCTSGGTLTNSSVIVPLQGELFDTNGNFASSRYTAPVSGYYQINAQGWWGSAGAGGTEWMRLYILKNGSQTNAPDSGRMNGAGDASRYIVQKVNQLMYLAAGDYIELWMQGTGSRDIVAGASSTFMSGFLMSRN